MMAFVKTDTRIVEDVIKALDTMAMHVAAAVHVAAEVVQEATDSIVDCQSW